MEEKIKYPFLPAGRTILYVGLDDPFMRVAKELWAVGGCVKQPTAAVVVKNGKIIGQGTNAGIRVLECPRWGSPTGTNYGPCKDICKQEGHAEAMAVKNALKKDHDIQGADLYLYGHWWCCQNCWETMIRAGIKDVYLFTNSWNLFNPEVNLEMKNWGRPKK
jgi:deoxycytidylate deaminase